jgi:hypothetical protein
VFGTPILGISGSDIAPACRATSETLRPGAVEVSLRAGGATQRFRVDVPDGDARYGHAPVLVIGADGRIAGLAVGSPSLDPHCG